MSVCAKGLIAKHLQHDEPRRFELDHEQIACNAVRTLKTCCKKVFVFDDKAALRYGKQTPGISSHFDHSLNHHAMAQQMITLELSDSQGFVPLNRHGENLQDRTALEAHMADWLN